MSKSKRFKIVHLNLKRLDMCDIQDTAQETPTFYNDLGHISSVEPVCELLNKLNDENEQLQEKIEMDKNDFFISEAKRMRLLAFIEDNGLRKEYYEWERRIWNE